MFLCSLISLIAGGCIGVSVMAVLQINRINRYEAIIRKLENK